VIKPPTNMDDRAYHYLGRSKNGVYFASFIRDFFHVWVLNKSPDRIEWTLKGEYDLKPVEVFDQHVTGPWFLEDINYD
jgi:hypothetical protein